VGGVRTELVYGGRIFCFTDAKRRAKKGGWKILVRKEVFFVGEGCTYVRGEGVYLRGRGQEGVSRENKKGREKRCTWR